MRGNITLRRRRTSQIRSVCCCRNLPRRRCCSCGSNTSRLERDYLCGCDGDRAGAGQIANMLTVVVWPQPRTYPGGPMRCVCCTAAKYVRDCALISWVMTVPEKPRSTAGQSLSDRLPQGGSAAANNFLNVCTPILVEWGPPLSVYSCSLIIAHHNQPIYDQDKHQASASNNSSSVVVPSQASLGTSGESRWSAVCEHARISRSAMGAQRLANTTMQNRQQPKTTSRKSAGRQAPHPASPLIELSTLRLKRSRASGTECITLACKTVLVGHTNPSTPYLPHQPP